MAVGLSSAFNILERSPHDTASPCSVEKEGPRAVHGVPSHSNMRATTKDDRLFHHQALARLMSTRAIFMAY